MRLDYVFMNAKHTIKIPIVHGFSEGMINRDQPPLPQYQQMWELVFCIVFLGRSMRFLLLVPICCFFNEVFVCSVSTVDTHDDQRF